MSQRLTPLLAQYRQIKSQNPDTLLLFRVGDFYEMFYEDATTGSRALGLALTARSHGPGNPVPLAGFPAKAVDSYIARLVAQGLRIAVCDQLEPPDSAKPVVRRDVVEVITPGTLTRESLLSDRRSNYLLAVSRRGDNCGIAFADVSTGEFSVGEVTASAVAEEIQRIDPREVLLPRGSDPPTIPAGSRLTYIENYHFDRESSVDGLSAHYGVAGLSGFGVSDLTEGLCAAGAVLHYLEQTQRSALPHLLRLTPFRPGSSLFMDGFSRRNLEIVEPLHPEGGEKSRTGTLYSALDRTQTPLGGRLLHRWLLAPLTDVGAIRERQDAIAELLSGPPSLTCLREELSKIGDMERVAARVALDRANARDLQALRDWLAVAPNIRLALHHFSSSRLARLRTDIGDYQSLTADIARILVDTPPSGLNDGGLIRPGVDRLLDELRELTSGARNVIARLQEDERRRTGIPNLRIRFNSVFGYYIEVTKSHLGKVPPSYTRKQTVLNAERFVTPELKEHETRALHSEQRACEIEYSIFCALRKRVAGEIGGIQSLCHTLSELDVLTCLAEVARERRYARPTVDDSMTIEITAGRHPVVEQLSSQPFVPNDTLCDAGGQQILIITGPNMAGKSTYLRQVALIAVMAQVGSYVPAARAHIGVCDKLFTRIGASDDLTRGVSTFLAEMTETANILNNATSRSLLILDEVGRGTSTSDGLAIAWATIEHLHGSRETGPRTLFATHYRELTDLPALLQRCRNYGFLVQERGEDIVFLRRILPGPADRSYGIAVAKLGGMPESVITRARELQASLDQVARTSLVEATDCCPKMAADRVAEDPVLSRLRSANVNDLTPLQALNLIAELQKLGTEAQA